MSDCLQEYLFSNTLCPERLEFGGRREEGGRHKMGWLWREGVGKEQ